MFHTFSHSHSSSFTLHKCLLLVTFCYSTLQNKDQVNQVSIKQYSKHIYLVNLVITVVILISCTTCSKIMSMIIHDSWITIFVDIIFVYGVRSLGVITNGVGVGAYGVFMWWRYQQGVSWRAPINEYPHPLGPYTHPSTQRRHHPIHDDHWPQTVLKQYYLYYNYYKNKILAFTAHSVIDCLRPILIWSVCSALQYRVNKPWKYVSVNLWLLWPRNY